jgi:CRISPR-associated protein Cas1
LSWRTIVVQSHAKLSYKNGYMIARGEDVKMVHLSEINTVIIDSTQVSMTSYLYLDKMFGAIEQRGFITSMIYQFE